MKIYTKTGDKGTTGLVGGTRIPKHDLRIDCYGTVDELNSYLGLIRDQAISKDSKTTLIKIQNQLFIIGSLLATDPEKLKDESKRKRLGITFLEADAIAFLETEIDAMNLALPPMTHFILPGGHQTVSFCHIARCICRRAERNVSKLNADQPTQPEVLIYLNRLSDFIFVLARKLSKELEAEEIKWIPNKPS
ncbi:cob(I)yrinic acid a c-diamide adenosyltransferase [Formosa sp. Hel1_33_131]|jgi:cob(I)alamin adenosyltransferase|uniref:cob(I)yrinic acid a,c-diamide adenosyltransferase n=1 Tax=Formosa sp. Hel1_33_131 TaxID=1336794 RepID=UPI00084E0B34|nr:cob(I)yrinic acid a,c-diamide adenosyltransferase [Formosa sp. Hel1_33_131]AOR27277.1 cob(I)yrinic acid a c-diamide adenosyltransferase [Formosa sp. Hel1_33_131]